jgi:hypothetical protein
MGAAGGAVMRLAHGWIGERWWRQPPAVEGHWGSDNDSPAPDHPRFAGQAQQAAWQPSGAV